MAKDGRGSSWVVGAGPAGKRGRHMASSTGGPSPPTANARPRRVISSRLRAAHASSSSSQPPPPPSEQAPPPSTENGQARTKPAPAPASAPSLYNGRTGTPSFLAPIGNSRRYGSGGGTGLGSQAQPHETASTRQEQGAAKRVAGRRTAPPSSSSRSDGSADVKAADSTAPTLPPGGPTPMAEDHVVPTRSPSFLSERANRGGAAGTPPLPSSASPSASPSTYPASSPFPVPPASPSPYSVGASGSAASTPGRTFGERTKRSKEGRSFLAPPAPSAPPLGQEGLQQQQQLQQSAARLGLNQGSKALRGLEALQQQQQETTAAAAARATAVGAAAAAPGAGASAGAGVSTTSPLFPSASSFGKAPGEAPSGARKAAHVHSGSFVFRGPILAKTATGVQLENVVGGTSTTTSNSSRDPSPTAAAAPAVAGMGAPVDGRAVPLNRERDRGTSTGSPQSGSRSPRSPRVAARAGAGVGVGGAKARRPGVKAARQVADSSSARVLQEEGLWEERPSTAASAAAAIDPASMAAAAAAAAVASLTMNGHGRKDEGGGGGSGVQYKSASCTSDEGGNSRTTSPRRQYGGAPLPHLETGQGGERGGGDVPAGANGALPRRAKPSYSSSPLPFPDFFHFGGASTRSSRGGGSGSTPPPAGESVMQRNQHEAEMAGLGFVTAALADDDNYGGGGRGGGGTVPATRMAQGAAPAHQRHHGYRRAEQHEDDSGDDDEEEEERMKARARERARARETFPAAVADALQSLQEQYGGQAESPTSSSGSTGPRQQTAAAAAAPGRPRASHHEEGAAAALAGARMAQLSMQDRLNDVSRAATAANGLPSEYEHRGAGGLQTGNAAQGMQAHASTPEWTQGQAAAAPAPSADRQGARVGGGQVGVAKGTAPLSFGEDLTAGVREMQLDDDDASSKGGGAGSARPAPAAGGTEAEQATRLSVSPGGGESFVFKAGAEFSVGNGRAPLSAAGSSPPGELAGKQTPGSNRQASPPGSSPAPAMAPGNGSGERTPSHAATGGAFQQKEDSAAAAAAAAAAAGAKEGGGRGGKADGGPGLGQAAPWVFSAGVGSPSEGAASSGGGRKGSAGQSKVSGGSPASSGSPAGWPFKGGFGASVKKKVGVVAKGGAAPLSPTAPTSAVRAGSTLKPDDLSDTAESGPAAAAAAAAGVCGLERPMARMGVTSSIFLKEEDGAAKGAGGAELPASRTPPPPATPTSTQPPMPFWPTFAAAGSAGSAAAAAGPLPASPAPPASSPRIPLFTVPSPPKSGSPNSAGNIRRRSKPKRPGVVQKKRPTAGKAAPGTTASASGTSAGDSPISQPSPPAAHALHAFAAASPLGMPFGREHPTGGATKAGSAPPDAYVASPDDAGSPMDYSPAREVDESERAEAVPEGLLKAGGDYLATLQHNNHGEAVVGGEPWDAADLTEGAGESMPEEAPGAFSLPRKESQEVKNGGAHPHLPTARAGNRAGQPPPGMKSSGTRGSVAGVQGEEEKKEEEEEPVFQARARRTVEAASDTSCEGDVMSVNGAAPQVGVARDARPGREEEEEEQEVASSFSARPVSGVGADGAAAAAAEEELQRVADEARFARAGIARMNLEVRNLRDAFGDLLVREHAKDEREGGGQVHKRRAFFVPDLNQQPPPDAAAAAAATAAPGASGIPDLNCSPPATPPGPFLHAPGFFEPQPRPGPQFAEFGASEDRLPSPAASPLPTFAGLKIGESSPSTWGGAGGGEARTAAPAAAVAPVFFFTRQQAAPSSPLSPSDRQSDGPSPSSSPSPSPSPSQDSPSFKFSAGPAAGGPKASLAGRRHLRRANREGSATSSQEGLKPERFRSARHGGSPRTKGRSPGGASPVSLASLAAASLASSAAAEGGNAASSAAVRDDLIGAPEASSLGPSGGSLLFKGLREEADAPGRVPAAKARTAGAPAGGFGGARGAHGHGGAAAGSSSAALAALAEQTCEKWRLSVAQHEAASASCARAAMLCYSNRAATRMIVARMREALDDCLHAIRLDPNFLRVKLRAASCHLALGELEAASAQFQAALRQSKEGPTLDAKIAAEAAEGATKVEQVADCARSAEGLLAGGAGAGMGGSGNAAAPEDVEGALKALAAGLQLAPYSEALLELKGAALLSVSLLSFFESERTQGGGFELVTVYVMWLRQYEELLQLCDSTLAAAERNHPQSILTQVYAVNGVKPEPKPAVQTWRWRLAGRAHFGLGQLEEALELLLKADRERSSSSSSVAGGQQQGQAAKEKEALAPLIAAVRELLRHKAAGNEAFQAGRHMDAIEHYSSALASPFVSDSRPFSAVCFCNRAAASQALGQVADAIADCSRAVALDASYAKAISRRATLYEMVRDHSQALSDLQRLAELTDSNLASEKAPGGAQQGQQGGRALSRAYSTLGDARQARERLRAAEDELKKDHPPDFYLILGVEATCSAADIKKAYRKAALRHHPDKAGQFLVRSEMGDPGGAQALWKAVGGSIQSEAERLFKLIGEAHATLSDPLKRRQYDAEEELRKLRRNAAAAYSPFSDVSMAAPSSAAYASAFGARGTGTGRRSRERWESYSGFDGFRHQQARWQSGGDFGGGGDRYPSRGGAYRGGSREYDWDD
eukprot:jgi/Mesen1/8976/ME000056S08391